MNPSDIYPIMSKKIRSRTIDYSSRLTRMSKIKVEEFLTTQPHIKLCGIICSSFRPTRMSGIEVEEFVIPKLHIKTCWVIFSVY